MEKEFIHYSRAGAADRAFFRVLAVSEYRRDLLAFKDMRGGEEYYTLKNFKDCFTQIFSGTGSVGSSFWNTMKFFAYDVVIFPLGIVWGYVFYKKIRGYNFFRLMFYVPSILSSVVVAGMFKYLINADGPIGVLWAMTHDGVYANFLQEEEYAIGFKKDNTEFAQQVQEAFDEVVAEGTAAEISEKWFGKDIVLK